MWGKLKYPEAVSHGEWFSSEGLALLQCGLGQQSPFPDAIQMIVEHSDLTTFKSWPVSYWTKNLKGITVRLRSKATDMESKNALQMHPSKTNC